MKKIINGKIYNTDTATFIGNHQYANAGDFHYEDTDLYRTPKARFSCRARAAPIAGGRDPVAVMVCLAATAYRP
jgi:hypothetical protein